MMKKTLLTSITVAASAATLLWGAQTAQANNTAFPSLAERIAEKFQLKTEDVQQVFNDFHTMRHEEMEKRLEERLTNAVQNGTLTEEQKNAVLQKHEEWETKRQQEREQFQSMSREERKTAIQQRKEEMQQWAEENNIPFPFTQPENNRGMHGRMNW